MANLETVLNETETELIAIIKSAWGVSKVHTQPKEVDPTLTGLDEAYLLCTEVVADEEEGSICSESGRVKWAMFLHAVKPTSGSVVRNKRAAAQALQSAIKAGTFEHTGLMRYESTTFDVLESDVQVAQGAYLIRVDFSSYMEWVD